MSLPAEHLPPPLAAERRAGAPGTLYAGNTPAAFWRFRAEPSASDWTAAVGAAAHQLPDAVRAQGDGVTSLIERSLGEGQFGDRHWTIGSALRLYYAVKPVLPRSSRRLLRRLRRGGAGSFPLRWPIEDRYARFQWTIAAEVIRRQRQPSMPFTHFWPHGRRYAFVLTHDVETAAGRDRVLDLADLDASYGFRSSFNFVPERYAIDRGLLDELRARGFEIGIHGLKHDGKLFTSFSEFMRRAQRINRYLREFGAVGFRAPLTHRNPVWMQALEIDYDLSFFDTDPYEPVPGGTMSLWPFMIGRFVELPYTLVQDSTLTRVLGETSPRRWLEKVDVIDAYCGMALLNAHPDYLVDGTTGRVYEAFLAAMRERADHWHALPHQVARWWRERAHRESARTSPAAVQGQVQLTAEGVRIQPLAR